MRRFALRGALIALGALMLSACGDVNPTEQSLSRTATAFFSPTRPASVAAASANRPTASATRPPASVIVPATPTPIPAFGGSAVSGAATRISSAVTRPTATATRVPATAVVQVVTITADDDVNLRDAPSADATIVTQLSPGTEVTVVQATVAAQDGGTAWVKVSANGQMGYVRNDLVSTPHRPTVVASPAVPASGTSTPSASP